MLVLLPCLPKYEMLQVLLQTRNHPWIQKCLTATTCITRAFIQIHIHQFNPPITACIRSEKSAFYVKIMNQFFGLKALLVIPKLIGVITGRIVIQQNRTYLERKQTSTEVGATLTMCAKQKALSRVRFVQCGASVKARHSNREAGLCTF